MGRNVVEEGFRLLLLDESRRYSAVRATRAAAGHKQTERTLRITRVIRWDDHGIEQVEAIKLARMTDMCKAVVCMDGLFLSVMKVILSYAWPLKQQYNVPLAGAFIKDIFDCVIPS